MDGWLGGWVGGSINGWMDEQERIVGGNRDESWRQILGWEQLNGEVSFEGREELNARLDGCL